MCMINKYRHGKISFLDLRKGREGEKQVSD
jgi:hypothetical protein